MFWPAPVNLFFLPSMEKPIVTWLIKCLMPNQEISLARIPIRIGTQRNDLVFYNMYFWKTSPIGIGIWDIFHFSEIRLGLCNTWWMCSHKMLKKCLCWQRSGFKAFIMLCKMKKKPRLYLFQKYGTCYYYYYFWARCITM